MEKFIKPLLDHILNPSWKLLLPCFGVFSMLTFCESVRSLPGLAGLYNTFSGWFSLAWLYVACCIAYKALRLFGASLLDTLMEKRRIKLNLKSLTLAEKKLLSGMLPTVTTAVLLPINNPAVVGLKSKGIILVLSNRIEYRNLVDPENHIWNIPTPCLMYAIHPAAQKGVQRLFGRNNP